MCGIAGMVGGDAADAAAVERMCAAEVHRGPDSGGLHVSGRVALGVRRLAIIDVAAGDQPIANEDGSVVVVMNGEIYNFPELRRQLEDGGHRFATHSDTEVLVHLYEESGVDFVRDLRGMFAFALWDARAERLLLARDRVGKKPLYYREHDGELVFASELGALLACGRIPRRVDPQALDAFLTLLYVPDPLCAIAGVRKLPPASTLTWERGRTRVESYWRLDYAAKQDGSAAEIDARIRNHVDEAVRIRLMSERPVGAFLSGGVDSAAVVASMAMQGSGAVKTFSIGFTVDRFNELPYARLVAERYGTDHVEHIVEPDALGILPKLVRHYGDPFGDSSAIPSFYVSQVAAQEVTVALNGDGGDESFGGYNRYRLTEVAGALDRRVPQPIRTAVTAAAVRTRDPRVVNSRSARARRLAIALGHAPDRRYARSMMYTSERLRRSLYSDAFRESVDLSYGESVLAAAWQRGTGSSPVDRALEVDVRTYLPGDLLVKMDIASMANSLEARSPLLDHVLMEMAAALPPEQKVGRGGTKLALKRAMRDRVPAAIVDRPKSGFSIPLADWARGPLYEPFRDILLDSRTTARGYFRPAAVTGLLDEHRSGRVDRSTEIWLLVVLELWHREFVDGGGGRA